MITFEEPSADPLVCTEQKQFIYKEQKRKDSASSKLKQSQVAGADFETKDGYPHIFTMTQWDQSKGEYEDLSVLFSGYPDNPTAFAEMNKKAFGKAGIVFNIPNFVKIHHQASKLDWKQGRKGKDGKKRTKKGKSVPMQFYWNLPYDAQSVVKVLPPAVIDYMDAHLSAIYDTKENCLAFLEYDKGRYTLEDGGQIDFNRYVKITYLPKKWLQIDPLMHYEKGVKVGKIDLWDIMQFYGSSLDNAAKEALDEQKLDFEGKDMVLMGSMSRAGQAFTVKYAKEIMEYAELDSNLTVRLSWMKIQEFENENVRMIKPYSLASVAERACYDRSNIPTMNLMEKNHSNILKAAWTSYQGGWFEATGAGVHKDIQAYDITSAYPHIMWWIPDLNDGTWMGSFEGDKIADGEEYIKNHEHHNPSFFEAFVEFPEGRPLYPAAKMSSMGCLQNARISKGWFTGDEIVEFNKWGANIEIERWAAFCPNDENESELGDVENGVRYPFRPFIKTFYTMKMEQDRLRDAKDPAYDEAKRNVAKVMLNSIYGKTCQAIEDRMLRVATTGGMWSAPYSAVITGATRGRLAEFIRLNDYDTTLSVQTDGIILKGTGHTIPANHKPCVMDGELTNLGDWEDDGKGTLVLLMSGVYTILPDSKKKKVKSTFRGNYALFLDRRNAKQTKYGANWAEFLNLHGEMEILTRSVATDDAYSRPYSLGEARIRKDYSLVNKFRIIKTGIKAHGDSNKRNWVGIPKPTTFGDLENQWWESNTWELLV